MSHRTGLSGWPRSASPYARASSAPFWSVAVTLIFPSAATNSGVGSTLTRWPSTPSRALVLIAVIRLPSTFSVSAIDAIRQFDEGHDFAQSDARLRAGVVALG